MVWKLWFRRVLIFIYFKFNHKYFLSILGQLPIGGDSAPDVFIAKISSQSDHNYSLVVHNEPEVEVETEVETTIPFDSNELCSYQTSHSQKHQIFGNEQNTSGQASNIQNSLSENNDILCQANSMDTVVVQNPSFPTASSQSIPNVKSIGIYSTYYFILSNNGGLLLTLHSFISNDFYLNF